MDRILTEWEGIETDVVIPDGIEEIDCDVFSDSSIRSVVFPASLSIIHESAFKNCKRLEKVTFLKGVKEIRYSAFAGCLHINSIELPEGIEKIESHAFARCSQLNSINLPDSLQEIGSYVFSGSTRLNQITLPKSAHIDRDAFSGSRLTRIIIPKECDIKRIDDSLLRLELGICPFCNGRELDHSKDGEGLICRKCAKTLDWEQLDEMKKLNVVNGQLISYRTDYDKHFIIPAGINRIEESAFDDGFAESIFVPDTVKTIGNGAFMDCDRLFELRLPQLRRLEDSICSETRLAYFDVPESVCYIGRHAFEWTINLRTLVFPYGLKTIGESAFANSGIVAAWVMASLIGRSAFEDCKSLQWLYLDYDVTRVGDYAFRNCYSLKTVCIEDDVTFIGEEAFSGCVSLSRVKLPMSIEYIGRDAFSGCDELKEVELPDTLRYAGYEACFPKHTVVKYVPEEDEQQDIDDELYDLLCDGDKSSPYNAFETLYKRVTKAQSAKGQYYIGECYAKGLGVKKNTREAEAWFEKAAHSEYPEAMVRLYELTDICEKERNLRYVFQAANLGYGKAIEIIAKGYH